MRRKVLAINDLGEHVLIEDEPKDVFRSAITVQVGLEIRTVYTAIKSSDIRDAKDPRNLRLSRDMEDAESAPVWPREISR